MQVNNKQRVGQSGSLLLLERRCRWFKSNHADHLEPEKTREDVIITYNKAEKEKWELGLKKLLGIKKGEK